MADKVKLVPDGVAGQLPAYTEGDFWAEDAERYNDLGRKARELGVTVEVTKGPVPRPTIQADGSEGQPVGNSGPFDDEDDDDDGGEDGDEDDEDGFLANQINNPKGCNQYTGPGCSTGVVKQGEAKEKRAPPGSQMPEKLKSDLRRVGMVGTFPPAEVPLSSVTVADLSRPQHEIDQGFVMKWEQVTKSGRTSSQVRYTQAFLDRNAAEKYQRVMAIEPHLDRAKGELKARMGDGSLPQRQREAAAIASVIAETGLRPTDSADSIKHGHFGIASLQARHVKDRPDGSLQLDFIGKEGVRNRAVVRDPDNVAFLNGLREGKERRDFLFKASSADAGDALKEAMVAAGGPGDAKLKDLRTIKATQAARDLVKSSRPPKLTGDAKKDTRIVARSILELSGKVAKVLNNTASQARDNYIHPEVLKSWQTKIAEANQKRTRT